MTVWEVRSKMESNCPFCQRESLAPYMLLETGHFMIVCDYAPVAEGHLLLIPKEHYNCYAALPKTLLQELLAVKEEVNLFLEEHYAAPLFFEHGGAGQTVPHAHLHATPLPKERVRPGAAEAALAKVGQLTRISGLPELVGFFEETGPYLYWEENGKSYIVKAPAVQPGFLQELVAGWTGRTGQNERRPVLSQVEGYTGAKEFRAIKEKWEDSASRRPERSVL